MYYRNAHVVLFMYDITNRDSFHKITSWLDDAIQGLQRTGTPLNAIIGVAFRVFLKAFPSPTDRWTDVRPAALVGCKRDLVDGSANGGSHAPKRRVSESEGIELARKMKAHLWTEVSSKSAYGGREHVFTPPLLLPHQW